MFRECKPIFKLNQHWKGNKLRISRPELMQLLTVQDLSLPGLFADQIAFEVMLPKSVQSHSHFLSTEIDKAKSNITTNKQG